MTKQEINEIDLKEYGAMCEKLDNVSIRLDKFIENEFKHLSRKVDWFSGVLVVSLLGIIANLVILLVK